MELPVVAVNDKLKVEWPSQDGAVSKLKGQVIEIHRSKKHKHGSSFKYIIKFEGHDENYETRLVHLKYRVIGNDLKRKNCDNMKDGDLQQMKRGELMASVSGESLKYIVAPMVGASELAFRLLCRRYGATVAYTPMINSEKFAVDAKYRSEEFQTVPEDRPLVAHFSANNPDIFLAAAKHVEKLCDAIDLNLGCPQRVAFSGHFGSYLLDDADRELVLSIVKKAADNLTIPVFVKIRLLNTLPETIVLCQQLKQAGASLIAVHGRYRVNLVERTGPGARDGPAHLDQIRAIREAVPGIPIVANGNVKDWADVQSNMTLTGASGIMSAEGLLDNPALFNGGQLVSKLQLAREYLALVRLHPVKTKCLVFHIRRMCRDELTKYQLLEECLAAQTVEQMSEVVEQACRHEASGDYQFDPHKAKRVKEALERKAREEDKRKDYEARMKRKAKREGKPLGFYIEQGAAAPSFEEVQALKRMPKEAAFEQWKAKYAQHCYAFHFEEDKCPRERTCFFLHADSRFTEPEVEAFG